MTFVGNTPIEFSNIDYVPPKVPAEIADLLRKHHIFVTGSKNDPCPNSLIEALHCGLPAIALDSGGHPEIVRSAGELFKGQKDLLPAIDKVADNYQSFAQEIQLHSLPDVANQYYQFLKKVHQVTDIDEKSNFTLLDRLKYKMKNYGYRFLNKIDYYRNRIEEFSINR